MKMRSILSEQAFSKYEEYLGALTSAKEEKNYREYESIITDSLRKKQWEWFGRYYLNMDGQSKAFTKAIFKEASPF